MNRLCNQGVKDVGDNQLAAAAMTGSVRWEIDLGQASRDLTASLADLAMEPESIRKWLNEFAGIVEDLTRRRDVLQGLAHDVPSTVQLGELAFSEAVKTKLAARLGPSEGGMAWVIDGIVREMGLIHEAMLQSLATHLQADFDAESIIRRLEVGVVPGPAR